MSALTGQVAVVTGASRGVGKGIALGLGEAGATVYVTGRTAQEGRGPVALAGSVKQTAKEVTALGGQGVAVACDHRNDAEVEALFRRVREEQGRLDLLVNSAWAGYEGHHDGRYLPFYGRPFWAVPLDRWEDNFDGARWAYVSSVLAAPLLIAAGRGLIVHVSNRITEPGDVAYAAAKSAVDQLTADMAHALREHGVAVVSLYPGLVRTEGVLKHADYFDLSHSESPLLQGRAVAALAADPKRLDRSGRGWTTAELALEYGFTDLEDEQQSQ